MILFLRDILLLYIKMQYREKLDFFFAFFIMLGLYLELEN